MTTVRVLYFAGLRDVLGIAEEVVALPPEVRTVGEVSSFLARRHRRYGDRRASVRIARNEVFACVDETVEEGDVLALIPPVAGG